MKGAACDVLELVLGCMEAARLLCGPYFSLVHTWFLVWSQARSNDGCGPSSPNRGPRHENKGSCDSPVGREAMR